MPSETRARWPSASTVRTWLPAAAAIALSLFVAFFVWSARQERYRGDLSADFAFETRELSTRCKAA